MLITETARTEAGHQDGTSVYGYRGTEIKMSLGKKPSGLLKKMVKKIDKGRNGF